MTSAFPKRIFIDTSGWVEIILRGERYHKLVADYFTAEVEQGSKLFTSDYVLDEAYTRLATNQHFHYARLLREKVVAAERIQALLVLWTDETLFERAWGVFDRYQEHGLSFTDATIATLVRDLKIDEILTLDQGFVRAGLTVSPKLAQ